MSGGWHWFRAIASKSWWVFSPMPPWFSDVFPLVPVQHIPLDIYIKINMKFLVNFEVEYFSLYLWEGMNYLEGPGTSLLQEEPLELRIWEPDLALENCWCLNTQKISFPAFLVLKCNMKRRCQIVSRVQQWTNLINLEQSVVFIPFFIW